MLTLCGVPVMSHPLMDSAIGRTPRIRPMPSLPYLDESVRADFNAWLLKSFGEVECAYIIDGKLLVSAKHMATLRALPSRLQTLRMNSL